MDAEPGRFLEWPPASEREGSDPAGWLAEFAERKENRGAIAHWQVIPPRPARHGSLSLALPGQIEEALESRGITTLYTHQVQAIEALRGGLDTVVVTGTASGKSLGYHLPVLERLGEDSQATALYLFPTKALAQDQLKGLHRLAAGHPDVLCRLSAGVYDGDRQPTTRRQLRHD